MKALSAVCGFIFYPASVISALGARRRGGRLLATCRELWGRRRRLERSGCSLVRDRWRVAEASPPVRSTVVKPPTFPYGHVKLSPKEPAHKDNYRRAGRPHRQQNETERDRSSWPLDIGAI